MKKWSAKEERRNWKKASKWDAADAAMSAALKAAGERLAAETRAFAQWKSWSLALA